MIKGKDWKFTKFLDDIDDIEAGQIVIKDVLQCMNKLNLNIMNDSEIDVFLILCGFTRGCAWMKDKLRSKLDD